MGIFRVIPKEIKKQVLSRVKIDGVSTTQAAKDAGICADTVRNWLAKTADGVNNKTIENIRLKRELTGVYELLGKLTVELAGFKKRTDIGVEYMQNSSSKDKKDNQNTDCS